MRRLLATYILLAALALQLAAAGIRTFPSDHFLLKNTIHHICQDVYGFIWLATSGGIVRYDGGMIERELYPKIDGMSSARRNVSCLLSDDEGLWAATEDGLYFYRFISDDFEPCMMSCGSGFQRISERIASVAATADGTVCALGAQSGRIYVRGDSGVFSRLDDMEEFISVSPFRDDMLFALGHDGLYIVTSSGKTVSHCGFTSYWTAETVLRYNPADNMLYIAYGIGFKGDAFEVNGTEMSPSQVYVPMDLLDVAFLGSDTVFSIDGKGLQFVRPGGAIDEVNSRNTGLPGNVVKTMTVDRQGNLWLGIYRCGLSVLSDTMSNFSMLHSAGDCDIVTAVCPAGDGSGILYVGYDGGGLGVLDLDTGRSEVFDTSNSGIPGNNVLSVIRDDEWLYLGIYTKGLARFSLRNHRFENFRMSSHDDFKNHVWTMHDDGRGKLWIGSASLFVFDKRTGRITDIPEISYCNVSSICRTGDTVWVATSGDGLFSLDRNTFEVTGHYTESHPDGFPSNAVNYVFADLSGRLWLSTAAGFYSMGSGCMKRYSVEDGLADGNVSSMLCDPSGVLWASAGKSVFRYNPDNDSFLRFDVDGIDIGAFTYNCSAYSAGRVFFGNTSGLVSFSPSDMDGGGVPEKAYFFGIESFSDGHPETRSLYGDKTLSVRLPHDQNTFSVSVGVPEYLRSRSVMLSYRMEGIPGSRWHIVPENSKILFTGLQPGKYSLHLRHTAGDGAWRQTGSLAITVERPWQSRPWAIALWVLLASGAVLAFIILYIRAIYARQKMEISEIEKETQQKLNDAKFDFYTNMTHELRTPTFLIAAQLEDLMDQNRKVLTVPMSYISSMYRSAMKLNRLISKVIDFRKFSPEEMRVHAGVADVVEFCRNFVPDYERLCAQKSISFFFCPPACPVVVGFDADKLEMILTNLISNAFKYTHEGGRVSLVIADGPDRVMFEVKDNGIGIVESMQERIFETFIRTDNAMHTSEGDGMGLSFTKSLIEMHGGGITVDSKVGKGSTFSFWIPKQSEAGHEAAEVVEVSYAGRRSGPGQDAHPLNTGSPYSILLIDDEAEILNLLERHYGSEYSVYRASDGREGLHVAQKVIPDLVICDLMMPVMDGHGFLRNFRNDRRFDGSKVIMLTAKGSADDVVKLLDEKADQCMSKPVSLKVLDRYVRDLLERDDQASGKLPPVPGNKVSLSKEEKAFLKDCRRIIKENLDNPDFNAGLLAGKLSMSHSSLYKKIRTLTGMSVIDFVNDYKISMAVDLFNKGETNVESVCWKCGFRDVKNFRNLFRRKVGMLPKQYCSSL